MAEEEQDMVLGPAAKKSRQGTAIDTSVQHVTQARPWSAHASLHLLRLFTQCRPSPAHWPSQDVVAARNENTAIPREPGGAL